MFRSIFGSKKRIIKMASLGSFGLPKRQKRTIGQKIADRVASIGGSWTFIIIFGAFLFSWMVLNSISFIFQPFDPHPFILLNLILSCMAALQAPVIMISQRRLDEKDRELSEHDLEIDIQAINKLIMLDEKIDKLISILNEKEKI